MTNPSPFTIPPNSLSCFYYLGSGERCGAPSPALSHFCATHLFRSYRTPSEKLLSQAADALIKCTSFNKSGLISISCKDLEAWGNLSNSVSALVLHGYRRDDEVLDLLSSTLFSNTSFREHYTSKVPKKWKTFETLVARLHLQQLSPLIEMVEEGKSLEETLGVQVYWDHSVVGRRTGKQRQIDVAIMTSLRLYNIFTAIECKDSEVEVGDVEAFITKLDDIGAHKGVIASSIGFQDGAKQTAKAYGIETLIVEEQSGTETIIRPVPRFKPVVLAICFEPPNDIEPRSLNYELSAMKISDGRGKEMPAAELVGEALNTDEPQLESWPPLIEHKLPAGSRILLPDSINLPVAKILLPLKLEPCQEHVTLTLPSHPFAFSIRNVISGLKKIVPASEVPLIAPRNLEPGRFYINLMCQRYYCEKIEGGVMTLTLLDDKQHGHKISATMSQELRYSSFYYSIEDSALIEKLRVKAAMLLGLKVDSAPGTGGAM